MTGALTAVAKDLGFVEAPRWHQGRLWFSDFSARTVMSVDESGNLERHAYVPGQPSGLGFAPDGSLRVVSTHDGHILAMGTDGSATTLVADIGAFYRGGLNDMIVDEHGRAYVSAFPAHLAGRRTDELHGEKAVPMFLVSATGEASVAATDLAIPNGMAIADGGATLIVAETMSNRLTAFDIADDGTLSGRRVFAELGDRQPDGICLDTSGAVWFGSPFTSEFVLVEAGGDVVRTIATPGRWAVSCALGGSDGRTLWCATVEVTIEEYRQGRGRGAIEMCSLDESAA